MGYFRALFCIVKSILFSLIYVNLDDITLHTLTNYFRTCVTDEFSHADVNNNKKQRQRRRDCNRRRTDEGARRRDGRKMSAVPRAATATARLPPRSVAGNSGAARSMAHALILRAINNETNQRVI